MNDPTPALPVTTGREDLSPWAEDFASAARVLDAQEQLDGAEALTGRAVSSALAAWELDGPQQ